MQHVVQLSFIKTTTPPCRPPSALVACCCCLPPPSVVASFATSSPRIISYRLSAQQHCRQHCHCVLLLPPLSLVARCTVHPHSCHSQPPLSTDLSDPHASSSAACSPSRRCPSAACSNCRRQGPQREGGDAADQRERQLNESVDSVQK